ncbi:MAG: EamA family transporter [Chlamydiota bacterium]
MFLCYMHKEHLGFLYGTIAAIASAAMAVTIKLAADLPTETMVFARFVLGLPLLLPFIWHKRVHISLKLMPKHLVRGFAGLAALYCYFYAVKELPLVNAVTLSNTAPLFMPLVVWVWLRMIVSKLRMCALSLGFVGVLILLRPIGMVFEWASLAGLCTGLLVAIALLGVRQLSKTESTETILVYYFLICTVLTFLPMLLAWKPIPDFTHWMYLVVIAVVSMIFQFALTKSFSHAPATKASTLIYLAVVFGGLAGWLIFGEVPDVWVWIGTCLIILGALLALFDPTPSRHIHPKN